MRCFFDFLWEDGKPTCQGIIKPAGGARPGSDTGYCEMHANWNLQRAKWYKTEIGRKTRRQIAPAQKAA